MEEQKFVVFQLEDQKYGMSLMRVNGIEQDYHIIPVPNAPEGISGIINLRGAVIPVYSLRERFGMDPHIDNPEKSLLVTNSHGILLAYEVDCVEEIEEVPDSKISLMPSVASNEDTAFMEQVLQIGNEIIITINVDKVLSEDVRQMVDQIVEENQ
ncbi:purine-binding chemotaxis protein CheW [Clostridium sp. CAG:590]|jgi:purine-binding chemotaxis protein CheW|nr:chemotaxis protein CheW [Clostridium sp.]CCX86062.1 purine-binding chemotaxis protein CheW [Clostridium sp. CAG:590]